MNKLNGGDQVRTVSNNVSVNGTSNNNLKSNETLIFTNKYQVEAFEKGNIEIVIEEWLISAIQSNKIEDMNKIMESFMNLFDLYNISHPMGHTEVIINDIANDNLKRYYEVNSRNGFTVSLYIKIVDKVDKTLVEQF